MESEELARRVAELRALAGEHASDPITGRWSAIICDGCRAVLHLDLQDPSAPGWKLGPPDYCPTCARSD